MSQSPYDLLNTLLKCLQEVDELSEWHCQVVDLAS
jgi:hypothetical protein